MSNTTLQKKIDEGLSDHPSWIGRHTTINHLRPAIIKTVAAHPELSPALVKLKDDAVGHLEELLPQTIEAMKQNGFQVYMAEDAKQACDYIADIVENHLVVKSKTNTGKEIGITKRLLEQGATVYETDLGDRLAQLEGKGKAAHTLAPACHLTRVECAELLSKDLGENLPADPEILVGAARRSLREAFLKAEVGISGANAIAADTGAVFLTENEGNIRCVTSIPKVHIVIAGIEKIVRHFSDGLTVVRSASTYGCGQDIGTYVSIIDGVSRFSHPAINSLGGAQGPEEVHVVFLKQGRKEAIDAGCQLVLYCLNCGGCLNTCPVYNSIGENFGYKYLGGRGTVFTMFHTGNSEKVEEAGLSLCIGCGRCEESCPLQMPTPQMILKLRADKAEKEGNGFVKESVFHVLGSNVLAPLMQVGRNVQHLPFKQENRNDATMRFDISKLVPGAPKDRLLPTLAKQNFTEIIKNKSPLKHPKGRVAVFGGCMVNYAYPQLGLDLFDVLTANQISVYHYEKEACCGLPAIMSGDTKEATRMAIENVEGFSNEDFDYLLFLCPSCATTVKEKWEALIENIGDEKLIQKYKNIQNKVMDVSDYLVNVLQITPPKLPEPVSVTWHDPCHLVRGLGISKEPRQLLEKLGAAFTEMDEPDSCCGFGGSFSLFHYDVSRSVNDEKISRISDTGVQYVATGCPGCIMHLKDGLYRNQKNQEAVHIISLLAKAYRQGGNTK
ncbi:MAG: LUD domain-containing protein [Peptococcaceae bacterium]|nr:LUD domain-containing protein [Peptococcaceae bacterium]